MWTIEYEEEASRELIKLDRQAARHIKNYLDERIATDDNPRRFGESLAENLAGFWKYRIGDYRAIVEIQEDNIVVLVVRIEHRSRGYWESRRNSAR